MPLSTRLETLVGTMPSGQRTGWAVGLLAGGEFGSLSEMKRTTLSPGGMAPTWGVNAASPGFVRYIDFEISRPRPSSSNDTSAGWFDVLTTYAA